MNFARDNYYQECPAVMDYSAITDYRTPSTREEYIRNINNIVSDHEYRLFLQKNASKIMDGQWSVLNKSYSLLSDKDINLSPIISITRFLCTTYDHASISYSTTIIL